ncbi:uncharacterized protein LOC135494818 [Lineus longissimus]|uniref:uncharacterized protein LOC135494818 n=1 Tax=Lineus longissimus TaxID=88925 RepID=UPI002B4C3B83
MAAVSENALCIPMQYNPKFKVYTRLDEPIWGKSLTSIDEAMEVLSLCSQLDFLCKKELSEHPTGRIDHGKVGHSFEMKAIVLLDQLQKHVEQIHGGHVSTEDYLEYTGFAKLFPRAAAYVSHPKDLSISNKSTHMDNYYSHMACLHQVVSIANQIIRDLFSSSQHKYMAHQLALLFQSLSLFKSNDILNAYRTNIEQNFNSIKDRLHPDSGEVTLTQEQQKWLFDVMTAIVQTVQSFPVDLTKDLFQLSHTLQQL